VVFGEGCTRRTAAPSIACAPRDGRPVWRFDLPGELVHIEASPSIANGRVIVGGGSAGVICVDLNNVTLNGTAMGTAQAEAQIEKLWKEMADKYEIEKKKDPDFAIPPSEAALPKPAPKLLWQQGKGAWHVDAPVLAAGDKVFVTSAFLDKEKLGDRSLICLNAADGTQLWKTPLKYNAWAGATLAGDRVIVPCSNIRYDPKELPMAKGEVVALKVSDGSVEWRKETTAILATAAVAGETAVICDTEGQIRAFDVKTGAPKWASKVGAAFFAGPAVAGDTIYAADIDGMIHALGLADGKAKWKLDLGTDAAVKAPGMVYGSPIVTAAGCSSGRAISKASGRAERRSSSASGKESKHEHRADRGGRLAFCGPDPQGAVAVDKEKKTVRVPARSPRASWRTCRRSIRSRSWRPGPRRRARRPRDGRDVRSDAERGPQGARVAGAQARQARPRRGSAPGPELELRLEIAAAGNAPARSIRFESILSDKKTGKPLPNIKWHFTGSALKDGKFGADVSGTLISLYPVTDEVVMQSGLTMREEGMIKLDTAKNQLPPEGTAVTLVIKPAAGPPPAMAAAGADPEKQVLKLSRTVGPAEAAAPAVGGSTLPPTGGPSTDPFEHRKEVRSGKSLPDSSRPADLPKP
jgi:outer membrane protein assembly factor BamB